jgi:putative acetyltransferase
MLTIRPETPEDTESISYVNEQAFSQKNEAEIVVKLREHGVLMISLVAVQDDEIVGHIAFSPVAVEGEGQSFKSVALAPMAVLPMHQHQGIGSQMVRVGLNVPNGC